MKTIESLINKHKGGRALIVAAGSSIKDYENKINSFILEEKPVVIGINNITEFFIPDYHLWTNTKRFRNFGKNILPESEILLGAGIHLKTVREVLGSVNYTLINFTDMKEGVPIGYKKGKILGFFRTAGNLSIMIAHLMGSKDISIVGMDGHTFYNYEDVKYGKKSQHCYGEGYTDNKSWERSAEADQLVYKSLKNLQEYGINFKILTPTIYEDFYDSTVFGESNEN